MLNVQGRPPRSANGTERRQRYVAGVHLEHVLCFDHPEHFLRRRGSIVPFHRHASFCVSRQRQCLEWLNRNMMHIKLLLYSISKQLVRLCPQVYIKINIKASVQRWRSTRNEPRTKKQGGRARAKGQGPSSLVMKKYMSNILSGYQGKSTMFLNVQFLINMEFGKTDFVKWIGKQVTYLWFKHCILVLTTIKTLILSEAVLEVIFDDFRKLCFRNVSTYSFLRLQRNHYEQKTTTNFTPTSQNQNVSKYVSHIGCQTVFNSF